MPRTAHYIASSHWDREWYEPFQGFRMRLVSMLDEVFETFERDPAFRTFVMDGQVIPVFDYLEIRPEKRETVLGCLREGRLKIGPWYVLPDEWLVSGESIVRNIQTGMALAEELGAKPSRAGFACDMFGHIGQLPQIFDQLGITGALIWRGIHEREHGGQLLWKGSDGTVIPAYRFGKIGYCSYAIDVRKSRNPEVPFVLDEAVERLAAFTIEQGKRTPAGPVLLFDGGDHLEIEPETSALIARANERLAGHGIEIVHSDLDAYLADLAGNRANIDRTIEGELRETGRDPVAEDEQWLIPGVLSSRIHLKQKNAACEDELCLWAEPFSAFAAEQGREYPDGYLRTSWRHLLENHPHDSICGCSVDRVHEDMLYRFGQSLGISSRLTAKALKSIALAAVPETLPGGSLALAVFNPTASAIDEPVDIEIPLPADWPVFSEFFGYEDKFSFRLRDEGGNEVPYQLVGQRRDRAGFRNMRRRFPVPEKRHVVTVAARLIIPAFGYTTLTVEPDEGPTRHLGTMAVSHRAIENEFFTVTAESNGTISVIDKRTGKRFEELLTFEERADIGDGWYHGIAVNDCIHSSAASGADVALVADGINKATLRITLVMNVPKRFDFRKMARCDETAPLKIVSDVTLRRGVDRIEVETTVENTILDHRVRVLFPTGIVCDTYLSDSAFDVVERPVALAGDNDIRRELDVETRPQITWTAVVDGESGCAVVSRGLPESAVTGTPGRTIALTLLRGFRKAVMANDNPGGQVRGNHTFRYWIVPFTGKVPVGKLFLLGRRVGSPARTVDILPVDMVVTPPEKHLPRSHSFLSMDGNAVVTSVQRREEALLVRLFNPYETTETVTLRRPAPVASVKCFMLDGRDDSMTTVVSKRDGGVELLVPPKRIATVLLG